MRPGRDGTDDDDKDVRDVFVVVVVAVGTLEAEPLLRPEAWESLLRRGVDGEPAERAVRNFVNSGIGNLLKLLRTMSS